MKRLLFNAFALTILSATLFCGCTSRTTVKNPSYTFTDDLGRQVSIPSFERTAALLGSFADVWVLSGGGPNLCATADDAWDDFGLGEQIPNAANLGATKNLSLEILLASKPHFVIASTNTKQHLDWLPTLEAANITVAFFDVSGFDDYLRMLKICTDITSRPDLYEKNGLDVKKTVDSAIEQSKNAQYHKNPPKVLFLRASAASVRAKNSHDNVLGEMLADLGCINIADSDSSLLETLSVESIIAQNPQHIFVVQVGDNAEATKKSIKDLFDENPAWQKLDAVKNGRVHFMDKRLYNLKPNSLWGQAYEQLEKILEQ